MLDISIDTPFAVAHQLFAGLERLHPLYVAVTVLIAAVLYWRHRRADNGASTSFLAFLLPRTLYTHPSSIVDYKIFAVLKVGLPVFGALAFGTAAGILSGTTISIAQIPTDRSLGLIIAFTVASILAYDFAKYFAHRLFHEMPILWEFHKVHHSAQVLTPITNWRFHPVEAIFTSILVATALAIVVMVFNGLFGAGLTVIEILGINALQVLFHFTGSNLRHSHIWLSFGKRLEHIFISPAQHQIHHSCEDRHLDKNYGFQFALWDWAFGSLYVPEGREAFRIGLVDQAEEADHDTLAHTWLRPFKRAYEVIRQRGRGSIPAN